MNKFEKRMKQELDDYTPDLKDRIKARANLPSSTTEKKGFKWQYVATPLMTLMVLVVAIITPIIVLNPADTDIPVAPNIYTLSMQVVQSTAVAVAENEKANNPSVAIVYGEDGIVTSIKPLNKDGIVFVSSSRLSNQVGVKVDKVTKKVVGEMEFRGCFDTGKLEMVIIDKYGKNNDRVYNKIKTMLNTDQNLQNIEVGKMSEEELDALEDDIEQNEEKYYEAFKTEITDYLNEKLPRIKTLAETVYGELKKINPILANVEVLDSVNKVKELSKNNEPIFNETIINIICQFVSDYPMYDDIEIELEDDEEFDNEKFYDVYKDIIEEYEEVLDAIGDINNGRIPEDIDDMLEDIFFQKNIQ